MTWRREDPQSYESDKIAALVIPYTRGRGLDIGCGLRKCWPHMIGVDSGHHFGKAAADIQGEADDLSLFADASVDFVFSSHLLEHFLEEKVPAVLGEWARVLKPGGHLVLYVPSANHYPKVSEEGANPDHKWDIYPGNVERHLQAGTSCGWTQLEREERSATNEYSLFLVFRKREDGAFVEDVWQRNPAGKPRALVIRYGAIGDQIIASSVLPLLREEGFHVTYNTTPDAREIMRHDPHVDEWLIQDKDQVPNAQLGPYWESLRERYDRIVNLCESVEGSLLALPGRLNHAYSQETRNRLLNRNYIEVTHDIAAVPYVFRPKFYATAEELRWGRGEKARMGTPLVMWAINGSSPHKVYPWTQIVCAWLLQKTPCQIVLSADPGIGKELQGALVEALEKNGADLRRVHPMAGKWKIREALSFAQVADCVVGPETGTLNAVSMESVPKVIYLSHSSHENLTKHWRNATVLEPDRDKAPCWPCHMMHYTWEHCHQDDATGAALCASAVSPERVFEAIALSIGAKKGA